MTLPLSVFHASLTFVWCLKLSFHTMLLTMIPAERAGSGLVNSFGFLVWHLPAFWLGPSLLVVLPVIVSLGALLRSVVILGLWAKASACNPSVAGACLHTEPAASQEVFQRELRCDFCTSLVCVSMRFRLNWDYLSLKWISSKFELYWNDLSSASNRDVHALYKLEWGEHSPTEFFFSW